jgi:hypothetical protein
MYMNLKKQLISMNYTQGTVISPEYIVIHETANKNSGANAQAHWKYWNTNSNANSSVHFVVDDHEVVQLAEFEPGKCWRCWHVGDNKGHSKITNSNSIGIEICVNSDGDFEKARQNCIELVKWLMPQVKLGSDKVVRHYDASGKWCPANMLNKPELWNDFILQISAPAGTPIIAKPSGNLAQAKEWAKNKGATTLFISLADIFWKLAPAVGVDPVVAYTQSAKETGYGKFGGVLDESFRNPCGMKRKEGGGDYDKEAHQRFLSWEEGIQAQIDHLALYAGAPGYPKSNTPDPRHFDFIKGTAPTIEQLGGKWAPSPSYGTDIVKMMSDLQATKEPQKEPEAPVDSWKYEGINGLADAGLLLDREGWSKKIDEPMPVWAATLILYRIFKDVKGGV